MIKKTITYEDFNGEEVEQDFFFHLSEAELVEMDYSEDGGMQAKLDRIIKEKDQNNIVKYFKEILLASHGVKSSDGRRFIKDNETRAAFEQSPAYSIIFMNLLEDDKAAVDFINGVIPEKKVPTQFKPPVEN